MHTIKAASLAGAASIALMANCALAQENVDEDPADATIGETIIVYGEGQTRQVQEVESEDITILLPGTSVIRAIERLPSVNVQAADPFGNYEWSTRVTIRSFNQNQLGFTFDGVPLGDMSYGNHNGLHISRAVTSENVGSVIVSQGAGAIGTNSTGNLGGTVETFSMDPDTRFGIDAAATYGSDETMRGFVRANFGSASGPRGFVSYAYGATDKYKGEGTQDQHMVNAKLVVPVGMGEITGWAGYSDRAEQDYQDMSLGMLDRLGYDWDNTFPDYDLAILLADIGNNRGETGAAVSNAAAGTVYPLGVTSVDDAYFDASGLRRDLLTYLGYATPLGDAGELAITGYYHDQSGRGLWGTPYVASPNGVPISIRTTEYEMQRTGVFARLGFELAFNTIDLTGWYENNDFNQARRFYGLESRTEPGRSFREWPENPFFTQWEFDFNTETLQYSVSDRIELGMLTINLGWKGFRVTNQATAVVAASFPQGEIQAEDWFQPHVGFNRRTGRYGRSVRRLHPGHPRLRFGHHHWPVQHQPGRLQCHPRHSPAGGVGHLRTGPAVQFAHVQRCGRGLSGQLPQPPAGGGIGAEHRRQPVDPAERGRCAGAGLRSRGRSAADRRTVAVRFVQLHRCHLSG